MATTYQIWNVTGSNGTYTISNGSGNGKAVTSVTDNVSNGTGDSSTVLGDVSSDKFTLTLPSPFTSGTYTYLGVASSGGSVVGFFASDSSNKVYLISKTSTVSAGSTVTETADNTSVPSTQWNLNTGSPACFVRGTRVMTSSGEVPVEDLKEGTLLLTRSGAYKPLRWVGRRSLVTALILAEERAALLPVRIARGALGEGLPQRDLLVSPEHCMMIDGVLIPAGDLVNGISITRCDSLEIIEYFHLELPAHDVIFAEGAATESYLDCGNRNMFENVEEYVALYGLGDAVAPRSCLPVVKDGARLTAARRRLRELAESGEAGDSVASLASGFAPASLGIGGARATL